MDLKDVEVTYINEPLVYFKCKKFDTTIIVTAGISCAYYGLQLPSLGTKFNIEDVPYHSDRQYNGDTIILSLCHKRYPKTLKCLDSKVDTNTLIRMIPKYGLGCGDLLIIMKMYEDVQSTVTPDIDLIPFILSYTENILTKKDFKETDVPECSSNQLYSIKCMTVSQCRQTQDRGNFYRDFPYWSFGTCWALNNEVLIGTTFSHNKVGTICLKDSAYTMGCVIVKDVEDNLEDILDKPVYIEKFCVMSEIFNPNNKFNLEYLYVNFKDVHVMGNKRKREFEDPKLKFKMTFLVLDKSNVSYTRDKGSHFWIEITDIKNCDVKIDKCFLCLPEPLIKYWSLLEHSRYYTMWFSKDLVKIRDYEYNRVNSKLPQYQVRTDNISVIHLNKEYTQPTKLPFLSIETLPDILKTTGLVSFQAILKYRKFNPNNSSRTSTSDVPIYFGTIGEKTHILDFQVDKIKTLTLYLNNWERMMNPLGLLPGALVNVRNVQVQKTYCKSTAFTYLELVEYKPPCIFRTAGLFEEEDWGSKYFFGGPNNVPDGILVHGVVNSYKVIKMFMKRSCSKCFYMSREPGKTCLQCGAKMETITELMVAVNDERGPSKITIKSAEVCRVFLGMDEGLWEKWLSNLEVVGQWCFQRYGDFVNYALNQDQVRFVNRMNNVVKLGEMRRDARIHMLCRKLDNSRNFDRNQPFWYGLKARIE